MSRNVALGGLLWAASATASGWRAPAWWVVEALFLLAPLVLVPLALGSIETTAGARRTWSRLHVVPAIAVAFSFQQEPGPWAAALAGPWLLFTLLLAARGLDRLRRHGFRDPAELAIDGALLFVPVGGGWLALSRLGATPMGFEEPFVLLTAVHFHYAAFTALTLVGLAGRGRSVGVAYRAIVAGVAAGTPLVAVGITASPVLEALGVVVLAASLWGFARWSWRHVRPALPSRVSRGLLAVSCVALWPSMAFAVAYAWGHATGHVLTTLPMMARVHGTLNAVGFGFCGLLGWALASRHVALATEDRRVALGGER